jgi:sodium-dependent dicarboxylate transporter 2/3/5
VLSVNKRSFGLILGIILLLLVTAVMPLPAGMTENGLKVLGIIACALALWLFDVFPIGISSVCAMAMLPLLGVMPYGSALKQFMGPATFFVIATYGISLSLISTPLSSRILRSMIKITGTGTERIIFALMATTAILSTIMSNIPVTAMMMSISTGILNAMDAKPGYSNLGRTLMIGIPFAAMCGGIATPSGSSVNVVAIDILNMTTGERISFLDWMIYGTPLMLILLPFTCFAVIKIFKPEEIPLRALDQLFNTEDIPEKITKREWKAIAIIFITVVLWVLGAWVPILDMTLVATLSMIAFFLPGINIFTWDDFAESISWDAVFTVGSVMSLGSAVISTELGTWIVERIFSSAIFWPSIVLFMVVALVTNFIHIVLPVAPAIVTMILPSILVVAENGGHSTIAFTIIVSMMATCIMLLPIDTITVLTYSKKYYSISDMLKVGVITSCIWAVVIALWSYLIS